MNQNELDELERQLHCIAPAKLPEVFAARLLVSEPLVKTGVKPLPFVQPVPDFLTTLRQSLRWLIPVTPLALMTVLVWQEIRSFDGQPFISRLGSQSGISDGTPLLKADNVRIDQRLVSSFDAVARLPGGEPVRFRCENWMDQVVLSDKSRGLVVENSKPRVEVVPLGFETY